MIADLDLHRRKRELGEKPTDVLIALHDDLRSILRQSPIAVYMSRNEIIRDIMVLEAQVP